MVFADSMKRNPNIDAETLEALVTQRTRVIVPVHYAGVACDMDTIMAVAKKHNLLVVEDAAQAVDSYYKGRPLGGIGHLAAFSFHETKNITAGGEGGLLVVNDERFVRRAEIIWEKGTNRAEFFRGEVNKYGWVDMGSSFLPSEVNAAFLWAQVENMDDVQEINVQPLPGDAFAHESGVKQDMQDATGCYDILMGVSYVNETATTTMTRDNNASLRFKTVVRAIIKDLLLPIADKFLALDQQFLDEERALRLVGQPLDELFRVSPKELAGAYDVIYCGTATESMANRELNKERVLQAYSLALNDPAYLKDDRARLKLFRKVLLALGIAEAEDLLPEAPAAAAAEALAELM